MQQNTNLSRADKIILAIMEMSNGKKINLKFEDIVVAVFKKFPEDFHLRGYEEYPDSGDVVHKPLYDFRKKGFLEANNKVFCLTDRGMTFAEQLTGYIRGKDVTSDGRMSRFAEKEIARIETSEAFLLFLSGKSDKITDTDFYQYFGVTPRTSRNDFLGRLKTVASAVDELGKQKSVSPQRSKIKDYHGFLTDKFSAIIQHFKIA
jgi:hypothetical protein